MDLSSAITIERPGRSALDINSIRDPNAVGSAPLSGYSVEQVDFSSVPISSFIENVPQIDGVDGNDPYLGARTINLVVSVYGNSYADFWDKMNELNYALQAQPKYATGTALPFDATRKISFSQPSATGTYSLYMKVRPVALPRFVTDKASAAGVATKGYAVTVNVGLFAEDPYKYFESDRSFSVTGSGTLSVINDGKTVAWPTVAFSWSGSSTVTPFTLTLGSDTVTFAKTGGFLTTTFSVDFKNCITTPTASLNNATAYEFFSFPPGTNSLSVTTGTGVTTTVTIREALI